MFVYQSTLCTLKFRKDKGTEYFICWESTGVYNAKLTPLYSTFLHNINLFAYIIGTQSDKSASVVEENNYTTKITNAYTVYDLDSWPKVTRNNCKLKIVCLVQLI